MSNQSENSENTTILTSEYINSLPILKFAGPIEMINTACELGELVEKLRNEPCIGFDTESRPSFIKGTKYPISLIQLATPSTVYIIRFAKTGLTGSLLEFMQSDVEKIGVGLVDDAKKLRSIRPFEPKGIIDLSDIAKSKGLVKSGLRTLSARYLNHRIVKTAQKTNWAKTSLTENQLRYAATDAWACLLIRPLLEKT